MGVLEVGPASSRAELERAINQIRAERDRMPAHWEDRREECEGQINDCLGWWLTACA